uniref:PDZ domain-containing protein n=1 Tax=Macrostomum lignano TaxID=282301 RepID=A0A1I8HHN9_9PLAT
MCSVARNAHSASPVVENAEHFMCECPAFPQDRLTYLGPNPDLSSGGGRAADTGTTGSPCATPQHQLPVVARESAKSIGSKLGCSETVGVIRFEPGATGVLSQLANLRARLGGTALISISNMSTAADQTGNSFMACRIGLVVVYLRREMSQKVRMHFSPIGWDSGGGWIAQQLKQQVPSGAAQPGCHGLQICRRPGMSRPQGQLGVVGTARPIADNFRKHFSREMGSRPNKPTLLPLPSPSPTLPVRRFRWRKLMKLISLCDLDLEDSGCCLCCCCCRVCCCFIAGCDCDNDILYRSPSLPTPPTSSSLYLGIVIRHHLVFVFAVVVVCFVQRRQSGIAESPPEPLTGPPQPKETRLKQRCAGCCCPEPASCSPNTASLVMRTIFAASRCASCCTSVSVVALAKSSRATASARRSVSSRNCPTSCGRASSMFLSKQTSTRVRLSRLPASRAHCSKSRATVCTEERRFSWCSANSHTSSVVNTSHRPSLAKAARRSWPLTKYVPWLMDGSAVVALEVVVAERPSDHQAVAELVVRLAQAPVAVHLVAQAVEPLAFGSDLHGAELFIKDVRHRVIHGDAVVVVAVVYVHNAATVAAVSQQEVPSADEQHDGGAAARVGPVALVVDLASDLPIMGLCWASRLVQLLVFDQKIKEAALLPDTEGRNPVAAVAIVDGEERRLAVDGVPGAHAGPGGVPVLHMRSVALHSANSIAETVARAAGARIVQHGLHQKLILRLAPRPDHLCRTIHASRCMSAYPVRLYRNSTLTSWGFRLQGGADLHTPIIVQRVFAGSPAEGQLQRGDILTGIENYDATCMLHSEAQELVRNGANTISLNVKRPQGGYVPRGQSVGPMGRQPSFVGSSYQQNQFHHQPQRAYQQQPLVSQRRQDQYNVYVGGGGSTSQRHRSESAAQYDDWQYRNPQQQQQRNTFYAAANSNYSARDSSVAERMRRFMQQANSGHQPANTYHSVPRSGYSAAPSTANRYRQRQPFMSSSGAHRNPFGDFGWSPSPDKFHQTAARPTPSRAAFEQSSYLPSQGIGRVDSPIKSRPGGRVGGGTGGLNQRHSVSGSFNGPRYSSMLQIGNGGGAGDSSGTPAEPFAYNNRQYNTPINMYSRQNVTNAFEGQTGIQLRNQPGRSANSTQEPAYTQSQVYKLVHEQDQQQSHQKQQARVQTQHPHSWAHINRQESEMDEPGVSDRISSIFWVRCMPSSCGMARNCSGGDRASLMLGPRPRVVVDCRLPDLRWKLLLSSGLRSLLHTSDNDIVVTPDKSLHDVSIGGVLRDDVHALANGVSASLQGEPLATLCGVGSRLQGTGSVLPLSIDEHIDEHNNDDHVIERHQRHSNCFHNLCGRVGLDHAVLVLVLSVIWIAGIVRMLDGQGGQLEIVEHCPEQGEQGVNKALERLRGRFLHRERLIANFHDSGDALQAVVPVQVVHADHEGKQHLDVHHLTQFEIDMASIIDPNLCAPLIDLNYVTVSGVSTDAVAVLSTESKFERESEEVLAQSLAVIGTDEQLEKLLATEPEALCNLDELEELAQQMERENESTSSVSKEVAIMKRFTTWLTDNNLRLDFKEATAEEIAKYVRYFYANQRKPDGSFYSPNTMVGIRAALFRYLMKLRGLNIIIDPTFHAANLMIKHVCNAYLKNGGRIRHYGAIESDDMNKLAAYFDRSGPLRLLDFNGVFTIDSCIPARERVRERHSCALNPTTLNNSCTVTSAGMTSALVHDVLHARMPQNNSIGVISGSSGAAMRERPTFLARVQDCRKAVSEPYQMLTSVSKLSEMTASTSWVPRQRSIISQAKFMHCSTKLHHLLTQLKRGHDGVRAAQRHVSRTSESSVGIQPRPGPFQRVVVLLNLAVLAQAGDHVRLLDSVVAREEHLDDLVVVVVGGQDQRGDVRRELRLLFRAVKTSTHQTHLYIFQETTNSPEERVVIIHPFDLVLASHVVRMLDDGADNFSQALADGVQQRLLDALETELVAQQLNAVHVLRVHSQVQRIPAHVVHAVDIEVRVVHLLERLPDDPDVPDAGRLQVDPLLVRQLKCESAFVPHFRLASVLFRVAAGAANCRALRHVTDAVDDVCHTCVFTVDGDDTSSSASSRSGKGSQKRKRANKRLTRTSSKLVNRAPLQLPCLAEDKFALRLDSGIENWKVSVENSPVPADAPADAEADC